MITSLLIALQFLTIFPVKIRKIEINNISLSMVFFPLVGIILGLILIVIYLCLAFLGFPDISLSIILVVSLIVFTGGLHLDGLSDTFDALLSNRNKNEMLNIMRDPHVGAMGIISIFSLLLLKISFIYAISLNLRPTSLLLMCSISRWAMVMMMFLFPYARSEGKAKFFIEGNNKTILFYSTLLTLIPVIFIWQIKGLFVLLTIGCFTIILGKFIFRKIGGITGDTLGATNEITEVLILLIVFLLGK